MSAIIRCWRHVARLIKCISILADVRHTKSIEYDSGSGFPGCEPFDKKVYCCHSDNEMYLGLVPLC